MRRYLAADRFGRKGRMKRLRIHHHFQRGTSMTRGSPRNCRKYRRRAGVVGSSGVPSWMRRMPVRELGVGSSELGVGSWEFGVEIPWLPSDEDIVSPVFHSELRTPN